MKTLMYFRHFFFNLQGAENLLCCDLCGFKTEINAILAHHMISRHQQPDPEQTVEFKCSIDGCHKSFKSKIYLRKHRQRVHKRDQKVWHNVTF